jgi:class 3 adenylate cyclase/hemoglobin-like flavoprotein
MWKVTYAKEDAAAMDVAVEVTDATLTLLKISLANGIPHQRECGGRARCTTCRVRILDGLHHVSSRTRREEEIAGKRGWDSSVRLACQTRSAGDVTLERLVRTGADVALVQAEALADHAPREQNVAILFCDIRGYTPLVERHLAYDVMHILNRFFAHVGGPIHLNNGLILMYTGDGLVAIFGASGDPPQTACRNAIRAGLGMLASLERLNGTLVPEFGTVLDMGIGVAYGPAILGHVGHATHRQFAAIGDVVNVAARIEAMNKPLGTRMLILEEVQRVAEQPLVLGKQVDEELKGKTGRHLLLEVQGYPDPDPLLLVQNSLPDFLEQADVFAAEFYTRLFAKSDDIRTLFHRSMGAQGRMLVDMLRSAVYARCRNDETRLDVADLGRRHTGYGVVAAHYPMMRAAFVETMESLPRGLGAPAVAAWMRMFDGLLGEMQAGTRLPAPVDGP